MSAQNGATVEAMSFIGFTNMCGNFSNVITETQSGATRTLSLDPTSLSNPALPQRGSTYSHNFVVPFYYGSP